MSIERTNSGTYRVRWRDDTGTQRAKSFRRKIDAQNFEAQTRLDLQRGTYIAPTAGTITLRAWADEWLAGARNLGAGGRDTYRRDLDRHILPALGGLQLRRVTDSAIDRYLTAELDRGLAPSTVHRHYRTLHRMLGVAVDRGRIPRNPCGPVTPPKIEHTEMRFLDLGQVEALAAAIHPRYRAWVYLAAHGGPRWSECVGLRRARVDGPRVTIAEQLVRRSDRRWHRDAPKTKAGRRTIVVPGFVADELAAHLDQWAAPDADGLVFPNRAGNPLISSSFTGNVFKPALVRAGLDPAVRIHDLRHTAVTLAIAVGAHPKAIQARMGHASISVTLDRYGHLFPEQDSMIAGELDRLRTGWALARLLAQ